MIKYFKTFDLGRIIAFGALCCSFEVLIFFMLGTMYDRNEIFDFITKWYALPLTTVASTIVVFIIDITAGVGRESPLLKIMLNK